MLVMTIPAQAQGDGQRYFERTNASSVSYTRADSLQGGVTAERAWWDLTHYHLQVAVDIENRSLSGLNRMQYRVRENLDEQTARLMQRSGVAKAAVEVAKTSGRVQIDFQAPMRLVSARQSGRLLNARARGLGLVYFGGFEYAWNARCRSRV